MQVPILNGIYADGVADFRTSYPVNMVPVPKSTGISSGYLRPAEGLVLASVSPGLPRGGIEWNGKTYRVMGTKLVRIESDDTVVVLGDVGAGLRCTFDYSFDRLAITSGGKVYYWDGVVLTQNVDPDLGAALAIRWVDGYFMTTDGTYLVVTEPGNPYSVIPTDYGVSDVDPDPLLNILKLRNEIQAIGRYTIEVFDYVGGDLFPFARIEGGQIHKGAVGTHAACIFSEYVAFLGSGRNEPLGIYIGANASATKISTREIDTILAAFTETELSSAVVEARPYASHMHLWVRLPDRTLVYDLAASQIVGEPVWFSLTSAIAGFSAYRACDLVWCYGRWNIADPTTGELGYIDSSTARHFNDVVRWEFGTSIAYNEGRGVLFNALELVCLTGRVEQGEDPYISTSYSVDGETWSQDRFIRAGAKGDRTRRLAWFGQGRMTSWRVQRFRGDSKALISVARIEATLEPLSV